MPAFRNISFATAQTFSDLLSNGLRVPSRDGPTHELLGRITELTRPDERYVFLPARDVSPVLQFAETMWVLAGRNDVEWLARYNRKAPDFSDNGLVWRAGYGPRLRSWPEGVDQLSEVRRLLSADRLSRRAVISLFDPALDFIESRDIPCNNWLSFMLRDDTLHMNVAIRSNDAVWGFSGVNAFEWSVLQSFLAHWLGAKIGLATYLASSFHLYDNRHLDLAQRVVDRFHGVTAYDHVGRAPIETSWADFPSRLDAWFAAEELIRANPEKPQVIGDRFFDSGLDLVRLRWGALSGWSDRRLRDELAKLPDEDHTAAAYQHFSRKRPEFREEVAQPGIAAFFLACREGGGLADRFKLSIKRLHSAKDRIYGRAWKRRGERISMLPNIARKVDRLEEYAKAGRSLSDESALDTAVDLYVYIAKYRLWLAEHQALGTYVGAQAPTPLSERDANVDTLVDRLSLERGGETRALIAAIGTDFEALWRAAEEGGAPPSRIALADVLLKSSECLVAALFFEHPALVVRFIGQEVMA